jgi:hypothetical protein
VVAPGGTLQLSAQVAGVTSQAVTWNAPTGNGTITPAGLYTAPSAPGTYQVTAAQPASGLNPGATGLISIQVGGQPPGPPINPTATSNSRGTATIIWTPPADTGGGPVTGYTITAQPGGTAYPVSGTSTSDTVGGLTPGATYTFTVTATTDGGTSLPSPTTNPVVISNVPGAGQWTVTKPPLPRNAGGLNVFPASVVCPSTTECVAVGYYQDLSGNLQGLLLTGLGRSWAAAEAPLPAGAAASTQVSLGSPVCPPDVGSVCGGASAVACPSTTECAAVGTYFDSSGNIQGLLLTGSGRSWAATKAPLPADASTSPQVTLQFMACPSTTECVATGTYTDSTGNTQGLLLSGSGGSWTATEAPLPTNASTTNRQVTLGSVACPSATSCVVAGTYADSSGNTQGLLLTGSAGTWTATEAPLPAGAAANPQVTLDFVACPSTTECVAAGNYLDSSGQQGFLLTGSPGSWTATEAPMPAGASSNPQAFVFGVTCPSATSCVVAGQYNDSQAFLVTGSPGSWTATVAPMPADAFVNPSPNYAALTCSSATACVFSGTYYDTAHYNPAFVVTGSGRSWTATKAPLPKDAPSNVTAALPGVACYTATECVIVGTYSFGGLLLNGPS